MGLMQSDELGFRREPFWLRAACVATILLCAVVLHREVLLRGHVYHMDDAADGYYPGHIAVARAFAHGELPTWERGSWSGWPLVVDPYNGVFYPLNVVYYVAGAARGLGFAVALHVALGGLGLWLVLRRRRLSPEAALFGALAYELSTFGVVRIRHVIFVQMMAWLPFILLGVERWLDRRRLRRRSDLAIVAFATGMALVAGALSIGHFAALAIGVYALARALPTDGASGTRTLRDVPGDLAALAGAALVGAMIAAAQLLPTVAHLPRSPRALGSDYAFASSYAWPTTRYALSLLAPDLFGGEDRASYVGAPNHWELCGWYVGALCVLAAAWSLLLPPEEREKRGAYRPPSSRAAWAPELYALAALVLLAGSLALGDAGRMHPWFYRHVPLYAALRCPARALLMAVLALPILGAHGIEALLDACGSASRARRFVGAGVALVALGVGFVWFARSTPTPGLAPRIDELWGKSTAHLHRVLAAGAAIVLVAALPLPRSWPRAPLRRLAGALLVLALALDLLHFDRGYVALQHKPADYPAGMERFAAVEWLRAHAAPDASGVGDRFVNDPEGPFRLHNVGMVLGLESASGYDSFPIWRYVELLHLINTGHRYPHARLRDDFAAIGVHGLTSPLLDLMNVRWLIAPRAPPGTDGRWVERYRPGEDAVAIAPAAAKWEPAWNPVLRVFENMHALPRAFVVHRAEVPGSDDRLAARLVSPGFDPSRTALLEEPAGLALDGDGPAVPARMVRAERSRLVIDTDDARPGLLVIGDAHYPGWSATVDGAPVPLLRTDWAFRGVPLPAGRHRVELRYRSRPTELGIALSLVGIALGLALSRRPRRRAADARVGAGAGAPAAGPPSGAVL